MARSKYLIDGVIAGDKSRDLEARELIIKITPRMYSEWIGTAAQLLDEGLIPSKFSWPQGKNMSCWESGEFEYSIQRHRPKGVKAPKAIWVTGDWWMVRRSLTKTRGMGPGPAALYEARCAYEHELWRNSDAGRLEWAKLYQAKKDAKFQTFLKFATQVMGSPSPLGVQQ